MSRNLPRHNDKSTDQRTELPHSRQHRVRRPEHPDQLAQQTCAKSRHGLCARRPPEADQVAPWSVHPRLPHRDGSAVTQGRNGPGSAICADTATRRGAPQCRQLRPASGGPCWRRRCGSDSPGTTPKPPRRCWPDWPTLRRPRPIGETTRLIRATATLRALARHAPYAWSRVVRLFAG